MIKTAVLVFTRVPIPGQTKTRLIPLLGAQGAAKFHQTVLQSTLAEAKASDFSSVEIWCATDESHPFLKQCELDYSSVIKIQQGNDLGERMHHASVTALVENTFIVIIGSDCPGITRDIINKTYQAILNGKDAVLGPAKDGGYYLLGLNVSNPGIFQDITWGEDDVAARTRQNLAELDLDYLELEELDDIDTPEDYHRYISNA